MGLVIATKAAMPASIIICLAPFILLWSHTLTAWLHYGYLALSYILTLNFSPSSLDIHSLAAGLILKPADMIGFAASP